jgi:hypothetical protein
MKSIQGILAIMVTSALIVYLFLRSVDAGALSLAGLVGTVWGFFFGQARAEAIARRAPQPTKGLVEDYRKLWTRIGGRPWTYIMRDIWYKYEFIGQALWFWTGVGVICLVWYSHLPFWVIPVSFFVVYGYGYLNGHLYFGKPPILNQTDCTDDENDYKAPP